MTPTTCPTCGSDKPGKLRLSSDGKHRLNIPCNDPFHDCPAPERVEQSVSDPRTLPELFAEARECYAYSHRRATGLAALDAIAERQHVSTRHYAADVKCTVWETHPDCLALRAACRSGGTS